MRRAATYGAVWPVPEKPLHQPEALARAKKAGAKKARAKNGKTPVLACASG